MPVPKFLRVPFFGGFSKMYGVDINESERYYDEFNYFTDFFTRTLKPEARKIENLTDQNTLASPCDGTVLTVGEVDTLASTIDAVKGRSYRLDEFMLGHSGDSSDNSDEKNNSGVEALLKNVAAKGNKLFYSVIYLSPGDYHRFHSPAIHTADYRRHIVGYLAPVKPSYVNKHKDVFKNNERVNIFGEWREDDFFFLSYVGALNVGSIKLDFDTDVVTNEAFPDYSMFYDKNYNEIEDRGPFAKYLAKQENNYSEASEKINFAKGEMTGRFEMGSTIVLVWEAPEDTQVNLEPGQKLKLGQEIVKTPSTQ
mmetsp:Transcript_65447/g.90471  ORF Transcript_65447/g.90471 Transcript_65447/m.90471 type:complete len:310 (-) Transcript_65447:221-1150(-)